MKKSTTLSLIMTFALLVMSGCNEKKSEPASPDTPDTPSSDEFVTDICGNKYKIVKIGDQYWMAENLRSNKYDTQSGREGAEIDILSYKDPKSAMYAPYCVNASEKNNWENQDYVTEELLPQIEKFGYLYNWAAAVGLEDENAAKQDKPFEGNRQGICPNGWHIPSETEFKTLLNFCGSDAGKKLRTTSGWYKENGTDEYSFAALPAGSANGSEAYNIGCGATFCSATPNGQSGTLVLEFNTDYINFGLSAFGKNYAFAVRCVKN